MSLIEDGTRVRLPKASNRLTSTTIRSNSPTTEQYAHDVHGNIIQMSHLVVLADLEVDNIHRDYKYHLQQVDLDGQGPRTIRMTPRVFAHEKCGRRLRILLRSASNLKTLKCFDGATAVEPSLWNGRHYTLLKESGSGKNTHV